MTKHQARKPHQLVEGQTADGTVKYFCGTSHKTNLTKLGEIFIILLQLLLCMNQKRNGFCNGFFSFRSFHNEIYKSFFN